MTTVADELRQHRIEKLERLRSLGIQAYADGFTCSHTAAEAVELPDGAPVSVAGRLLTIRNFGKLIFAHLLDRSGRIQVSFEKAELEEQDFQLAKSLLDLGDFIGIDGELWTTKKQERTVRAKRLTMLSKSLLPLPEKWHGLQDQELRYRKRYLDLISNPETRERFRFRSRLIAYLRRFLDQHGFLEVETPILQAASSGAAAAPFVTRHNALDRDLYLRISPETYLKRLVVGGLERVYEIGRNFRNEGIDPSHLQEFTMLEWYAAYWSFRDNMCFVREFLQGLLQELLGTMRVTYEGVELDFGGEWPEVAFRDAIREHTGLDARELSDHASLVAAIRERGVELDVSKYPSYPALLDALYKKVVRPKLIQPTFLTYHPTELVPLARRNDEDPSVLNMFQVVVNSWEIVKAYSELVDPLDQRERLNQQQAYRELGDTETMMMEEDYIECMEHGMPPCSGLGLGIDRLVALLTGAEALRDVVFFPPLREDFGSPREG